MSASAKADGGRSCGTVEAVSLRAAVYAAVRKFFDGRGYLEVETPIRLATPALEDHIDAVATADGGFLRTSPELQMKRLAAAGCARIYQLGPCFRAGEHGRRHRSEFAMLEWYCAAADYRDLMRETEDLLRAVSIAVNGHPVLRYQGQVVDLGPSWPRLTVAQAFARWTDTDPVSAIAAGSFDLLTVDRIEPKLGWVRPNFLCDYPIAAGGLARRKSGQPDIAERWELYIAGLELANAYSELIDPHEQRRRFAESAKRRRAAGREVYDLDEAFLEALAELPPTAGCALGLDRLLMLLADADDIAAVRVLDS